MAGAKISDEMRQLLFEVLEVIHECAGRLECGDFVLGDDDRCVLGNIAGGLFAAGFNDEAAEAAEVNVLTMGKGFLYSFHEAFDGCEDGSFFDAGCFGDFVYDVSFCHCCM